MIFHEKCILQKHKIAAENFLPRMKKNIKKNHAPGRPPAVHRAETGMAADWPAGRFPIVK